MAEMSVTFVNGFRGILAGLDVADGFFYYCFVSRSLVTSGFCKRLTQSVLKSLTPK